VKLARRVEYQVLGEVIGQLREDLGITQRALARKLGRTETSISKIESGAQRVDMVELLDISAALRVSLDDLAKAFCRAVSERIKN
jgi:transcriptional regulator with XRE-family HTH domain